MKRKIIVVDDEMEMGEMIKDYLDDLGYETHIAGEAETGLKIVQKEKPDLVLLDVVMPGYSGLECLKQIKQISPATIVIMISGMQDEELAKQAIQQGAYDYVTKPFELAFLHNSLLSRIFPEK